MNYINRNIASRLDTFLKTGKSVLLLGARQTGKTTLLKQRPCDFYVSFIQPRERLRYELDPSTLADEVIALAEQSSTKPLVIVDEVQKVPAIMDVVQGLIDDNVCQFVLTGSSARKLKHGAHINLLPGRLLPLRLSPLSFDETPLLDKTLPDLLLFGALPEIVTTTNTDEKEMLLDAYVTLYLEEEIRTEAIVRNVANFARFLELAASESGAIVNYSKLSQVVGVAHTTIAEYYQILEDCLIVERIEPLIKSKTRRKLTKSNKYLLFDMGLRRLAAKEGVKLSNERMGQLFEQLIGLELVKQAQFYAEKISIKYWRDADGPEVDWVIDKQDFYIPLEVKYTNNPKQSDAKHLKTFLKEYDNVEFAYVICQVPRKQKLFENIYAIPWQDLPSLFHSTNDL
ncbi:MAG: AAA family ATPase [Legionella sp.]|nr:AAA family ATPase [Legionella sp.]